MHAAKLASYLEFQRTDDSFERFYLHIVEGSKHLTSAPSLPRYHKRPRRLDDGQPNHHFEDPKALFRQQYFEAIDTVYCDLKNRFQQERGMPIATALETLLIQSANAHDDIGEHCKQKLGLYSMDINI